MQTTYPNTPELRQVLKGISLNREPGWHFLGNFLELSFDEIKEGASRMSLIQGPHCTNSDGQVNLAPICVLADVGMAASMRRLIGLDSRMATVNMTLYFTGAPRVGDLTLYGRLEDFTNDLVAPQGVTFGEIKSGNTLVCSAVATLLGLGKRPGIVNMPSHSRDDLDRRPLLDYDALSDEELCIVDLARQALESGEKSFVERFLGLLPRRLEDGAQCRFPNSQMVSNRVGHTQGGMTFALAAITSEAAFDPDWRLASVSASYISPGNGPWLEARTRITHQGRLCSFAKTKITDSTGKLVLDAVTQHARLRDPGAEAGRL